MTRLRSRFVQALTAIAILALIVTAITLATGGVRTRIGPLRLSIREVRNPLLVGLIAAAAARVLSTGDERRRARRSIVAAARWLLAPPKWVALALALLIAGATVFVGITRGTFVAAGADVYGYVSQAHIWATGGDLRIHEPLLDEVDWPFAVGVLSPLGYIPGPDGRSIVPSYSPGLPMVMAIFERIAGRNGVFYVVPLLGGVAVFAAYLLGVAIGSRAAGVAGALLVAASPVFLFQLMLPMSDVPVTGWWALMLALLALDAPGAALAAGVSAAIAILTRPNLVVVAVAPGLWLLWQVWQSRRLWGPPAVRLLLFTLPIIPACIAIAIINNYQFGSPLRSGYGPAKYLYSWSNVRENVPLYYAWMRQSQTLAIFLSAPVAAFLLLNRPDSAFGAARRSTVALWTGFVALVFGAYLPYLVFDNWFWLRFVLPAWPVLLVLTALGIFRICSSLPRGLAECTPVALVLLLTAWQIDFVRHTDTFKLKRGEQKTVAMGQYISEHLSPRAVFLTIQQSGGVRYYTNRLSLRFDSIPVRELDRVVNDLVKLGYHPYALLEQPEEPQFKRMFENRSRLGRLDWPPIVVTSHEIQLSLWDLVEPDKQKRETVRIF
jgi:hypothetical protein